MIEANLEQARFNMIEQQIRTWEVLDQRVLDLLAGAPREAFVPERYRKLAFADMNIPLGRDQVMMPPKLEARMLQALNPQPHETVLEVGTGSGFVTYLLSRLARHVYSVDIIPEFKTAAQEKLSAQGATNVSLDVGDAARGWPRHAPYDVIAITGSLPLPPEDFLSDLALGGRLFAVVGDAPVMEARLITRVAEDEWVHESLFETELTPLINAPQPPRFTL
ncbi:protein-L-isoaspartate O-methyltransferase [Ectothiorhodospiraceae bacterium 2226]|nr:protein-L-isoaspartate O-methyltransferase [Ectothiorhodospiraceae bacterium 2226]